MQPLRRLFGPRPRLIAPDRDLHQVAIDTLTAKDTPFAAGLAAEIERGRQRRRNPRQEAAWFDAHRQMKKWDREFMLTQLRPARAGEYAEWVSGWLQAGGRSFYRNVSPTPEIWVAQMHLDVRPLHGALSLTILVPEGTYDNGGDTGHTDLFIHREGKYLQRGFHDKAARPPRFVPIYSDMEELLGHGAAGGLKL